MSINQLCSFRSTKKKHKTQNISSIQKTSNYFHCFIHNILSTDLMKHFLTPPSRTNISMGGSTFNHTTNRLNNEKKSNFLYHLANHNANV